MAIRPQSHPWACQAASSAGDPHLREPADTTTAVPGNSPIVDRMRVDGGQPYHRKVTTMQLAGARLFQLASMVARRRRFWPRRGMQSIRALV